ncbi:PliI family lysozyme inhibitor of I-type lysozyme [Pedobacter sp. Leaf170]|uniref:PliI family lysozyme inhibitor of I-type lysozyme n=1 Tax=Pedobacter sp. Leaf170 TaxID=2876558 RepID=UPI001E42FCE8|nr:PliI family lysozyme inhibitor of I-type lysozyme [Pedobacter sp. Leaf170]
MKIRTLTKQHLLLLAGMLFCFACTTEPEKTKEVAVETPVVRKNPFPFYTDIEVKPGLNFEVFSWGKGKDSIGGYQILMSDSLKKDYRSLSVERNGIVNDAWNMDLDNDGNPEIYVQILKNKTALDLNVFEYAGGSFNKINFPSLTSNQKKGYKGNDKIFVKGGELYRSFPVEDAQDTTKTITKTYQYKLRGNSFSTVENKP